MAECIERGKVMQAFSDFVWNSNHSDLVPAPQWNHAVDIVRDFPAADVVEARHGRWIYNNMGGWHCSECNNQAPFWCMASTQNLSDYCPNCGAKMTEVLTASKSTRLKTEV